jgi:hypothetical protein
MSLREVFLYLIGVSIVSSQSLSAEHNIYRFPNAQVLASQQKVEGYGYPFRVMTDDGDQRAIKYVFLDPELMKTKYHDLSEHVLIDLPHLPTGDWNEAHIHWDKHTDTPSITNTTRTKHLERMEVWHDRRIDYVDFVNVETLQQDRMQVVTHADFNTPVLIKIASFPWEIPSVEREAAFYKLLQKSGATPEFLGHVTEGGRVIGFITEFIRELPSMRYDNLQGCLTALRKLHQRGVAHGDAHDGNCLIREDGSPVMIDFELSRETWSLEEFERDLDIMGRCIRAASPPT